MPSAEIEKIVLYSYMSFLEVRKKCSERISGGLQGGWEDGGHPPPSQHHGEAAQGRPQARLRLPQGLRPRAGRVRQGFQADDSWEGSALLSNSEEERDKSQCRKGSAEKEAISTEDKIELVGQKIIKELIGADFKKKIPIFQPGLDSSIVLPRYKCQMTDKQF